MIRWNANFVRGLAESVLERARIIRGSLTQTKRKPRSKPTVKATVKRARTPRRPNG